MDRYSFENDQARPSIEQRNGALFDQLPRAPIGTSDPVLPTDRLIVNEVNLGASSCDALRKDAWLDMDPAQYIKGGEGEQAAISNDPAEPDSAVAAGRT